MILSIGARPKTTALVGRAIAQKSIVKLPETRCYSGLLGDHPLYRRMTLATCRAVARLESDPGLSQAVRQVVEERTLERDAFVDQGLSVTPVEGLNNTLTFVAGLAGTRYVWETRYVLKGLDKLHENGPGIHREIFLGTHGIRTKGVRDLPEDLYQKLLARLHSECREHRVSLVEVLDDSLIMRDEEGASVRVVPQPLADGSLKLTLLQSELDAHDRISSPEIV